MTADFNVRKIHSDAERMDVCEHSLEIIIVPLKERIAETNFFFGNKHTIAEKIVLKQWITARSPVKINTVSFKE